MSKNFFYLMLLLVTFCWFGFSENPKTAVGIASVIAVVIVSTSFNFTFRNSKIAVSPNFYYFKHLEKFLKACSNRVNISSRRKNLRIATSTAKIHSSQFSKPPENEPPKTNVPVGFHPNRIPTESYPNRESLIPDYNPTRLTTPPQHQTSKPYIPPKRVNINELTGIEFEKHVGEYLQRDGYHTQFTKASGDFGVDIIATKNGKKFAVQVKRYKGSVSRQAVSDAVAGKNYYGCDAAMVITNSKFTKSAKEMAKVTNCILHENFK